MNWDQAYNKYCHNVFRHLGFINRYLHQTLNDRLEDAGYRNVRMQFITIIPYLGEKGARLTDLAAIQQTPKQTMAKLIKDAEKQNLIIKKPDPDDSRAKKIFITDRGIALVNDALMLSHEIVIELLDHISEATLISFSRSVKSLFDSLDLTYPDVGNHSKIIAAPQYAHIQIQLNSIVEAIDISLWEKNVAAGYSDLQNSNRIVLSHISEQGVRIADIAQNESITKQSISDMVTKLIEFDYIEKRAHPGDERSQQLFFTQRGKDMIQFSMENLQEIENKITDQIGEETLCSIENGAWQLWSSLGGSGPTTKDSEGKNTETMDRIADEFIRSLFTNVHNENGDISSQIFSKTPDGLMLTPDFLDRLRRKVV